jgi:hypothetical protein
MSELYDQQTVHLVRCPFCSEYHRIRLKLTSFGKLPPNAIDDHLRFIDINALLESKPTECPATKKTFMPDPEDWLHMSEEEFHRRFPGSRSN